MNISFYSNINSGAIYAGNTQNKNTEVQNNCLSFRANKNKDFEDILSNSDIYPTSPPPDPLRLSAVLAIAAACLAGVGSLVEGISGADEPDKVKEISTQQDDQATD